MSVPLLPPSISPIRSPRVRYLLLLDLALIWTAIWLAAILRFDSLPLAHAYLVSSWPIFLVVPIIRLPLYFFFNLYNRLWRYASTSEFKCILAAGLIAPLLIAAVNFGPLRWIGLPYSASRSIWLLEAILGVGLLAGSRLLLRIIQQRRSLFRFGHPRRDKRERVIIVGAGDTGAMVLRELQQNRQTAFTVVGFIDDDPNKQGASLCGVPVLGNRHIIPTLVKQHKIRHVVIAMPAAPGSVLRELVRICEGVGIRPRTVPSLFSVVKGTITFDQLRHVDIEDLLRREPVVTDVTAVHGLLAGRRVLVTGGGGSIGSELCRQILHAHPAELILIGHGENSLFEMEGELRQMLNGDTAPKIRVYLADTRMAERIHAIFRQCRPEVVFHTAAHKHVPLMESNPSEAVTNNILGTRNVLESCETYAVDHFVMVSTDKAVNPTSVMGASKRAAELLVLDAARRTGRPYVVVRFGNVLGSRGSVVLTFRRQIAAGGPVTVTHPEITRFFMTIPEAVQLVLQAAVLGHGGEILMLDMGEPVRIADLAKDLIRLSGLEVGRDIDIVYTGLRLGEKLYEDLFLPGEEYSVTAHPRIRIAAGAARHIPDHLHQTVEALIVAAQQDQCDLAIRLLATLIPEYAAYGEAPHALASGPVPAVEHGSGRGILALVPPPNVNGT